MIEDNVLNYISDYDDSDLIFGKNGFEIENVQEMENSELVLKCLELTSQCPSYGVDFKIRTGENRWRSVLDIWRHAKYYKPDLTIFEVMRILYENQGLLVGHYCDDVARRVFKLKSCTENCYLYLSIDDEFGLSFSKWKNIGLKDE